MVGETVNITGQTSYSPVKVPQCRLSEDLSQLFDNSSFSDVILVVGDRQFHVHKAILAARSCVFNAMFEHEMEEKKQVCG